jgi:hypothetical protein
MKLGKARTRNRHTIGNRLPGKPEILGVKFQGAFSLRLVEG